MFMHDCVITSSHFDFNGVTNYADIIITWQFLRGSIFKHNQIIPFCLFHIFIPSLIELTKVADLVDEDSKCYSVECEKIFISVK